MDEFEIVLDNSVLELVVQADNEIVVTGEDSFDVLIEADVEVLVDNDTIELLSLYEGAPGPKGEPGTKVTASVTPPPNPRVGDIWIVKN